ncbi:hypothetical protein [Spirochaeta isovalerica]|uniref:Uncharacterized protein n=1 Tax=Spirochaeta isovalerica TaxID=150 RepID=A0A841R8M1_9SPIO|nr:hypothetical protein [Spirochaeta isovalerica]MBB6481634.1 hypothetical protein [Spirochaeta isovalerica]
MEDKKCALCGAVIDRYDEFLHHFDLGDGLEKEICSKCSDRILKHQQEVFAKLFPTKAAKKRYNRS